MQIDVLEVEGKLYGFSGCHRYEVRISAVSATCPLGSNIRKERTILTLLY